MRNLAKILFLLLVTFTFSCEQMMLVDCNTCSVEEPLKGNVYLKIYDGDLSHHLVEIFLGKLEDNVKIDSFYVSIDSNVELELNHEYTFRSTTEINGKTYVTLDSSLPKTSKYFGCNEVCYLVVDNNVDLRIKYY